MTDLFPKHSWLGHSTCPYNKETYSLKFWNFSLLYKWFPSLHVLFVITWILNILDQSSKFLSHPLSNLSFCFFWEIQSQNRILFPNFSEIFIFIIYFIPKKLFCSLNVPFLKYSTWLLFLWCNIFIYLWYNSLCGLGFFQVFSLCIVLDSSKMFFSKYLSWAWLSLMSFHISE